MTKRNDLEKTKEELISELETLRRQVDALTPTPPKCHHEEALRKQGDYLQKLNDSLGDAVFTVNVHKRRVEYVNPAVERVFGYSVAECIGLDTKRFYMDESGYLDYSRKIRESIANGAPCLQSQLILKRKSGEPFNAEITTSFLKEGNQVIQTINIIRDITHREKTGKALKERVKELHCLYEVSRLMSNDSLSQEQVLQGIVDLIPESWQYPDITCARMHINGQTFATANFKETAWNQSTPIFIRDHRVGTLDVYYLEEKTEDHEGPTLKEERDLLDCLAREIEAFTLRHRQKTLLAESKERFRTILEQLPFPIAIVDKNQDIDYFNNKFTELFGYTTKDVRLAEEWWETVYPDEAYRRKVKLSWEKAIDKAIAENTEIAPQVWDLTCKDRSVKTVHFKMVPLGDISLIAMDDITEIQRSQEALEKAKQDAESANRLKSEFLANMSHDIRTPLNGILGFANLMLKNQGKKKEKRGNGENSESVERNENYLRKIISSGESLLALLNDILDFSKIEAEQLDIYRQLFNTRELCENVKAIFEPQFGKKRVTFNLLINPNTPSHAYNDKWRIHQVLVNLLSNAIKFTKKGCVTLSLTYEKESDLLHFRVTDTGAGITDSHLNHIFQPFFQVLGEQHEHGGAGLGLAICKRLANLMGGEIFVRSSVNTGTEFRFQAPAHSDQVAGEDLAALSEEPPVTTDLEHKTHCKILIAEDNIVNREIILEQFKEAGFHSLLIAKNGKEAVGTALLHSPDLILMDIQMPVMDGNEAIRRLRQKGYTKPIVAVSAYAMQENIRNSLELGATDYITKPIDFDSFFEHIDKYL